jgi:1-acyl-sn-glycerol-3-phosphate acyltransferase
VIMRSILPIIGVVLSSLSTVYLVLVLNTIQVLSILVYPFSPRLCRFINRGCARHIWGLWIVLGERMLGIDIQMTGTKPPMRQNALVLSNHRAMTDILCLLSLAWRCGRLGDLKWFVKDQLKWVPGVGWGMKFLDCIFVQRNWQEDKRGIESLFGNFKRNDIAMWLISFLEGTRFSASKNKASCDFAKTRNLYQPRHTLVPRVKGFVSSVEGLRSHVDAVYVVTIAYDHNDPSLYRWFNLQMPKVEMHVSVHPIETLPTDEAGLSQWAYDQYAAMDSHLIRLEETGTMVEENLAQPIKTSHWFRPESRRTHFEA